MFDGQTAADQHVESGQPAVFFDGDEVQIIGVQIDVVVRRNNDRSFEFARQVVSAQNGFGRITAFHGFGQRGVAGVFGGFDFFAVQPDFGIGAGFRQQVLADFLRPFVRFLVQPAFNRVAGTQNIAVDVARRGNGVQSQLVQPLVHGFDVGFEHAVILEGLAVGQADGIVECVAVGKLVYAQPLFGRDHAAGQAAAYHDVFQAFQFLLVSFGTDVAVVLFVHAVKTDELEVVAVEAAG